MQLFLQLVKTGLAVGLLYGLFAYGLSLILSVNKVFHIAHALSFVVAAHVFYSVGTTFGMPLPVSVASASIAAGLTGLTIHLSIYRPLGKRNADPMVVMVASITVLALGGFVVELLWGSNLKIIDVNNSVGEWFRWSTRIGGVTVNARDLSVLVASIVTFAGMRFFLMKTQTGLRFRAVGDHPERASSLGINLSRVFILSIVIGSMIATPAAVITAASGPIQSHMGFELLLKAVLALTMGGMGSMTGALVGGIFIGLIESIAPFWLPTEWAEFTLFAFLFVFLIFRPQGLFPADRKSRGGLLQIIKRNRSSTGQPPDPGPPTRPSPTVSAGVEK